jgi:hypothetical protein
MAWANPVQHEIIIEYTEKHLVLTPDLWAQLLPRQDIFSSALLA